MKILATLGIALCLSLFTAQAIVLTDTTPGGSNDPVSEITLVKMIRLNAIVFFDQAALDPYAQGNPGWLGGGQLNGGNTFQTNLLEIGPTPSCTVSWDFTTLPDYRLNWISVLNTDGNLWNIYHVNYAFQINSLSDINITINNHDKIGLIAFFGQTPQTVPDITNPALLLAFSLFLLLTYKEIFHTPFHR